MLFLTFLDLYSLCWVSCRNLYQFHLAGNYRSLGTWTCPNHEINPLTVLVHQSLSSQTLDEHGINLPNFYQSFVSSGLHLLSSPNRSKRSASPMHSPSKFEDKTDWTIEPLSCGMTKDIWLQEKRIIPPSVRTQTRRPETWTLREAKQMQKVLKGALWPNTN